MRTGNALKDVEVSEHRKLARDSLFLVAEVRIDGPDRLEGGTQVRVRNLSAGGMMAEGHLHVQRGQRIKVNIRNIGWVDGAVAWIEGDRTGIAFDVEIEPKKARAPIASYAGSAKAASREAALRKI